VLILKGLQAHISEVLILGDLLARSLILLDFKSFIISDLIKNEGFAEVLILEELGRAKCRGGWTSAGAVAHKYLKQDVRIASVQYVRISGGRTGGE
jgi:hypothetical protein